MIPSAETEIRSLTPSLLVPGTILPSNTIVKGRVTMVWGSLKSLDSSSPPMPRIAFRLSSKLASGSGGLGAGNDYISVSNQDNRVYHIKFTLYHSERPSSAGHEDEDEDEDGEGEIMRRMQEERNRLEAMITKSANGPTRVSVSVRCDGLKVLMVNDGVKGKEKEVFLEGYGKRLIALGDADDADSSFTILDYGINTINKTNNTPAWLDTEFDSSAPQLSSPFQSQSQSYSTPISAPLVSARPTSASGPGPSRLRPITTYPVPSLPPPMPMQPQSALPLKRSKSSTSATSNSNTPTSINHNDDGSPFKSKSVNPHDADERHPVKKPRTSVPNIPRESSSDQSDSVVSKEPPQKTHIVRLGPPPTTPTPDVFTAPPPRLPRSSSGLSETYSPRNHRSPSASTSASASRRVSFPNRTQSREAEGLGRRLSEEDALRERRRVVEAAVRRGAQEAQAESSRAALGGTQSVDSLNRSFTVGTTTYLPLCDLGATRRANVIGVVVKSTSAKRTSTGDWTMSVVIADPSRYANDAMSSEEFVVSLFRAKEAELPDPAQLQPGTVILFRRLVINIWKEKTKGQAYTPENIADNTWAILLDNHQDVKLANPRDMDPALTQVEVDRMALLKKWWSDIGSGGGGEDGRQSVTPSRRSSYGVPKDQVTLGQVRPNQFYDGTFKILYATPGRTAFLELYVTDGTRSSFPLRNFHNITEGLPLDAVHSISMMNEPPDSIKHYFEKGNCIKMCNLRPKMYKGELENTWSELPTEEQLQRGWKNRNCYLLNQHDESVQLIEKRIKALKRGEEVPLEPGHLPTDHAVEPIQYDSAIPITNLATTTTTTTTTTTATATKEHIELATHLSTIYKDLHAHPISTIPEILSNPTVPNKYRLRARVKFLHSRGLQGHNQNDQYVQKHCKHCKRAFKEKDLWCKSCNDTSGKNAEWRYRFVVVLEDELGEEELAIIVADEDAAQFLPALPPYSTSSNPNDIRKTEERKKQITNETKAILLGATMNGVRPRPLIDFSLQVYLVDKPGHLQNANKLESGCESEKDGLVVFRVFGMKGL